MKGFYKNKRWIAIVLMFVLVCTRVLGQIDSVYAASPGKNAEAESGVNSKTEMEPAVETESGTKSEGGMETGSVIEVENGAKTGTGTEAENGAKTGYGTEAENGTETGTGTEAEDGTETEPGTEDGAETESEAETEDGTETESEAETQDGTETESEEESETEEKVFQISGKVIDKQSHSVDGAEVRLSIKPKEEAEETDISQWNDDPVEGENVSFTNEEGEFTFTTEMNEDMDYSVSISKENFVTETVQLDPASAIDNKIQMGLITIEKAVKIEGTISTSLSGRNKGESGVLVSVLEHNGSEEEETLLNETETDADGKYSITVKYRQQGYIVRMQKEGYEDYDIPVQANEDVIINVDHILKKVTLNLSSQTTGAGSIVWKVFNEESNSFNNSERISYGGTARAYFKPNDKRYLMDCEAKPQNGGDSLDGEEVDSIVFEEDESGIAYIEIRNIKQNYTASAAFASKHKSVELRFDRNGKWVDGYEKNKYALEGVRILTQDRKIKFELNKGYYIIN